MSPNPKVPTGPPATPPAGSTGQLLPANRPMRWIALRAGAHNQTQRTDRPPGSWHRLALAGIFALVAAAATGQVANRSPKAADAEAAAAFTDLIIVDVAGGHHGSGAAAQIRFVQAPHRAALAVGQFLSYDRFHSKLLGASGRERGGTPSQITKTPGDFELFHGSPGRDRWEYACLRSRACWRNVPAATAHGVGVSRRGIRSPSKPRASGKRSWTTCTTTSRARAWCAKPSLGDFRRRAIGRRVERSRNDVLLSAVLW